MAESGLNMAKTFKVAKNDQRWPKNAKKWPKLSNMAKLLPTLGHSPCLRPSPWSETIVLATAPPQSETAISDRWMGGRVFSFSDSVVGPICGVHFKTNTEPPPENQLHLSPPRGGSPGCTCQFPLPKVMCVQMQFFLLCILFDQLFQMQLLNMCVLFSHLCPTNPSVGRKLFFS